MDMDLYSDDDSLSVEALVARNMGDSDWEDLANETPSYRIGGTRAKSYEADRMTFDRINNRQETEQ